MLGSVKNKTILHYTRHLYILLNQKGFYSLQKSWILSRPSVTTTCPRSSYPFHIVSYYINWVATSWTYSVRIFSMLCLVTFSCWQGHYRVDLDLVVFCYVIIFKEGNLMSGPHYYFAALSSKNQFISGRATNM